MRDPTTLLQVALLVATVGMVLVVLGTIYGSLFMPGAVVLLVGLLAAAAAGIWNALKA